MDGCRHCAHFACMQEINRSRHRIFHRYAGLIKQSIIARCASRIHDGTSRLGNMHAYLAEFTGMQCVSVHMCTSKSFESGLLGKSTTPFGVNLREASTMPGMVPGCLSERGQIFDVILPHPAAPRLAYNRSCSCVHACMHDYLCCVLLTGQVRRWGSYVIL